MEEIFEVQVSKDRLTALLSLKQKLNIDEIMLTQDGLNEWLQKKKIIFGIQHTIVQRICDNFRSVTYPVEIAKGLQTQNGDNAYLLNEVVGDDSSDTREEGKQFNFKNIRTIPSVQTGQLLARIVPPTAGTPGKDVYGNVLQARPGKPLRLRPGKNILLKDDKIYATTAGQISISANSVNVFPLFEVTGDLDLNTGNIDFVGNVTIQGNVPAGYEIKAGGDVKITGLVEGALITAQGSIYISGGIAGQKKAKVMAGGDLHTRYINQATVIAGNDINVDTFIMHSEVTAGNSIFCKQAHIIGGKISAGQLIEAGEIGNQHFARTELFIGLESELIEAERLTLSEITKMKDSLVKLAMLKERLIEKERAAGQLTTVESQMMAKQHETVVALTQKLTDLEDELEDIRQQMNQNDYGVLIIHDKIHPNNQVNFTKYSKVIQQPYSYVKLFLDQGEIVSVPL